MDDTLDEKTDDKPTTPRRERQSAARTNQILDAAASLFAERGFHRTTTREIADAADVAEGTLYNYFANKDDLLMGIMRRLSDSFSSDTGKIEMAPVNAREHFFSLLLIREVFQEQNSTMMQALLSEILADNGLRERYYQQLLEPMIVSLEKTLRLHSELGEIKSVDIPGTARVLASLIFGLFFLDVLGDPIVRSRDDALEKLITDLLFDGIAPDKTNADARRKQG
jgi:AcrR family transcriptional regulator